MAAVERIRGVVKEIGKIVVYFGAVLIFGALLAPPLFWAAQGAMAEGRLLFLKKYEFQKYFNRAVLIAAVGLLWPVLRWLRVPSWSGLSIKGISEGKGILIQGLLLGAGAMTVLAAVYLGLGVYDLRDEWSAKIIGKALISAAVVGVLEESLFRGGLLMLFRRSMSSFGALWTSSAVFAAVHFIKPDPSVKIQTVAWNSGFLLAPHAFHQFAEPVLLASSFLTLLVFGWILGWAVERTGALWMSIGLHSGLVFAKLVFEKLATRKAEVSVWVGPRLEVGLSPVVMLVLMGVCVALCTQRRPSKVSKVLT